MSKQKEVFEEWIALSKQFADMQRYHKGALEEIKSHFLRKSEEMMSSIHAEQVDEQEIKEFQSLIRAVLNVEIILDCAPSVRNLHRLRYRDLIHD